MEQLNAFEKTAKMNLFGKLPRWFQITLIVISIITMIWWISYVLIKLNKWFRRLLHWISEPRNYYWIEGILLFSFVCGLFILQFTSPIKPFTICKDKIFELLNSFKDMIISILK